MSGEFKLTIKWSGKEYPVSLDKSKTVLDLKKLVHELTNVLPKRQKFLGLKYKRGRTPLNDVRYQFFFFFFFFFFFCSFRWCKIVLLVGMVFVKNKK